MTGSDVDRSWTEHEAKFSPPQRFELPDLTEFGAGEAETRVLDATYHDCADLLLLRAGITLRHRTGDGGPRWTLKVPDSVDGAELVRRELIFPGAAGQPPAAAVDLVRAHLRGRALAPVAALRTARTRIPLRGNGETPLVEVVDDLVTATRGGRPVAAFREVEVELLTELPVAHRLLGEVVDRLVHAGCLLRSAQPKLVRVLGAAPPQPPAPRSGGKHPTVREAAQQAFARSAAALVRHDLGVRLGEDPEAVHQFRVAARRYRSDLRTFAPVLEADWRAHVQAELGWLSAQVGPVRDDDVLVQRLRRQARSLPACDAEAVELLLTELCAHRARARERMLDALRGTRYDRLLDSVENPRLTEHTGQLDELVASQWKRLARVVRGTSAEPANQEFHRIRIRTKRCRYAAEAAYGRHNARLARALARLQDVLGDHQDAVLAESWLRSMAQALPQCAVAAGELLALQRGERARCRVEWAAAWQDAVHHYRHR
ncbi:CYTH and CHAD domain-containing protein [Kutzneria viridogrisea]|uniref:CHAD domain-containing protein n=1 Tax=Kutzneria viridogrisea TaxID=47990 RepID=A0ABR6BYN7_9PSEU|nr:CHAD domain-containing protein [Kutzneria viridogrisea]